MVVTGPIARSEEPELELFRGLSLLTLLSNADPREEIFWVPREASVLADRIVIESGCRVLDLCTGTGVLALIAARQGAFCTGVDLNRHAVEIAKFNAVLNGLSSYACFRLGDLYGPVRGMQYDLIICNPPFEPSPAFGSLPLHSDAGENGTEVACRVLKTARAYLAPGGRLLLLSWEYERTRIVSRLFSHIFPSGDVKVVGHTEPNTHEARLRGWLVEDTDNSSWVRGPGRYVLLEGTRKERER